MVQQASLTSILPDYKLIVLEVAMCALKGCWQHCFVGQLIELSYNFCVDTVAIIILTDFWLHDRIELIGLGVRLAVGQRTLDPYAEVRILDPQFERGVNPVHSSYFYYGVLASGTILTS